MHVRVQRVQRSLADASFDAADVRRAVEDLALQVAQVDDVEVDDADRADAGGGEIHRRRRPEAAGADAQHLRGLQRALPVHADFRQDQVPAVAPDFVGGELRQRRCFGHAGRRPPPTG